MSRRFKRTVSLLLAFMMLLSMLPVEVLAYYAQMPTGGITITGRDGSTVTSDASWEETFPYGTFAFADSQVTVEEGEAHRRFSCTV